MLQTLQEITLKQNKPISKAPNIGDKVDVYVRVLKAEKNVFKFLKVL